MTYAELLERGSMNEITEMLLDMLEGELKFSDYKGELKLSNYRFKGLAN